MKSKLVSVNQITPKNLTAKHHVYRPFLVTWTEKKTYTATVLLPETETCEEARATLGDFGIYGLAECRRQGQMAHKQMGNGRVEIETVVHGSPDDE